MNFYDVYHTVVLNPELESSMVSICSYLNCQNRMEDVEKALWKKPSRAEAPGAFPFSEETGKIYDALWKAAKAENYSTAERIGRWVMKFICPPADDEGMNAYFMKGNRNVIEDEEPVHIVDQDDETEERDVEVPQVGKKRDDIVKRRTGKKDD